MAGNSNEKPKTENAKKQTRKIREKFNMASSKTFDFQELGETVDEIVQDLVCHVCQGFPKPGQPRWYKCSDLHYVCQFCVEFKKVDKCSCGKKISKNPDKVFETILKMKTMKFKCQYCHGGFTSDSLFFHETECTQRYVLCPFVHNEGGCNSMVKLQNVLTHYELAHRAFMEGENGSARKATYSGTVSTIPAIYRYARKIEAFGKVFLNSAVVRNGILHDYVQLLGSPTEAKDFVFSVEYIGAKCTNAFFGEVSSIDETFDSIISSSKCSTIGFEAFKNQFIKDDLEENECKYSYTITIKKLEEETQQ